MNKKNIKVTQRKRKVGKNIHLEVILEVPNTKELRRKLKELFNIIIPEDKCKYCGGDLDSWGSKDAVCQKCGKKQ